MSIASTIKFAFDSNGIVPEDRPRFENLMRSSGYFVVPDGKDYFDRLFEQVECIHRTVHGMEALTPPSEEAVEGGGDVEH